MKLIKSELTGNSLGELDTEIKYLTASAKADRVELICFEIHSTDDEKENKRITNCASRILKSMVKCNTIRFFVSGDELSTQSTESSYLKNKYPEILKNIEAEIIYFYVKI